MKKKSTEEKAAVPAENGLPIEGEPESGADRAQSSLPPECGAPNKSAAAENAPKAGENAPGTAENAPGTAENAPKATQNAPETGEKKSFWAKVWDYIKAIVPGVALCAVIAVPAWFLGKLVPVIGSAVFAIVIGMIIAFFKRPKWLEGGIKFTSKKVLQGSIVFLGFGMNFITVIQVGGNSILIILSKSQRRCSFPLR